MITTVSEVNNDKTEVSDDVVCRSIRSFVLLPNSMSKLIDFVSVNIHHFYIPRPSSQ